MNYSIPGILICLSLCGLLVSSSKRPNNTAIDCRKFVFAPRCRGVAAKRGHNLDQSDSLMYEDGKYMKDLAKNYNSETESEEDDDDSRETINAHDLDNSYYKTQKDREKSIYKIILKNRDVSYPDYMTAEEYENL